MARAVAATHRRHPCVSGAFLPQKKPRKKRSLLKSGDDSDDSDDGRDDVADEASAPALRDRFDSKVFGRCEELVRALIKLMVAEEDKVDPSHPGTQKVLVRLLP